MREPLPPQRMMTSVAVRDADTKKPFVPGRGEFSLSLERSAQNVCARNEAGLLQRFAGGHVVGIAAGAGNAAALVADSFQFLDKIRAETALTVRLGDFHVNVAIRAVVVVKDASGSGDGAVDIESPIVVRLATVAENGTIDRVSGSEPVFENDLLALDVACPEVQHNGKKGIVGLGLDSGCFAGGEKCAEKIEEPRAVPGKDIEFEDGSRSCPGTADEDGAIASRRSFDFEQVGLRPAFAHVHGIMDDLAIHFLAVEIAPEGNLPDTGWLGGKFHRSAIDVRTEGRTSDDPESNKVLL